MKRAFVFLSISFVAILAGCAAPNVVTSVTVFQNLSENDTIKTYSIDATPAQTNNLEFNTYVGLLNQQLERYGFTSVTKNPALKVKLKYGTIQKIESTLEPIPPSGPFGFYRPRFYGPSWENVVNTAYMHQMEVTMHRTKDDKNIYTVRARLVSSSPEISQSMGYLMESAFQRFPGLNGVTQNVEVPPRP